MDTIVIKLEPALLTNPDADMRYALPHLLAERSGGVIEDDGYDYVGPSKALVLYLMVRDLEQAKKCISEVIVNVRVLDNDLGRAATVAVQLGDKFEVIYPANWREEFVI
ncbi:MAG TPA: hypothetical protein VH280_10500 [Verrucomicrobiae bacterium]|jgi:hypothetical protein|nr:hypothetical protein [Verrucomicrobiae bacterium]